MAKPKQQPAQVPEEIEIIETGEEINSALEHLYADADAQPSQATVHVYYLETDGTEAKIWKGDSTEYDLDALARKHGSGKYRMKVYVPTERGNLGCKINKVFTYKLSAEEDARLKAIRSGDPAAVASLSPQPMITAESIAAAVRAAMPAPAVQQNPMSLMKDLAGILRDIMPQPVTNAPATSAFNPLDIMRMGFEFANLGRNNGDDEGPKRGANGYDVFGKLVDRFAPMFAQVMAQQPGAGVAALPSNAPAQPQNPEADAMNKLKMGLSFLCMQASSGKDADLYADVVLDNVPEDEIDKLLQQSDPVAVLAQFEPAVANNREWFAKLIASVKEALTEQEPEEAGAVDGAAKTS